jgi:hypothetical protein
VRFRIRIEVYLCLETRVTVGTEPDSLVEVSVSGTKGFKLQLLFLYLYIKACHVGCKALLAIILSDQLFF